jgi:hypothetical protein
MEELGRMIYVVVSRGLLPGFSMFVDNTLIFYGTDPDHERDLRCLFLCFEAILGLKINLAKSQLVLVGNVNNVDGLLVFWVMGFLLCP